MDITKKIDDIVANRHAKLPLLFQMQQQLEKVTGTIEQLDEVCQEAASGKTEKYGALMDQNPEITVKLRLINTKTFHECYIKTQYILSQLHNRFSRKQVHISFVGRAGQGKSLVMQNISGLSGDVIPSSDGADCTGTKSIITNQTGNEVSAKIIFYTHKEYKYIVNKYLQEIFGEGKFEVDSVQEISMLEQKNLQSQVDIFSAQKQSLYLQLEKYINHSKDVLPFLGTTKTVSANEIESYVAQYSNADKSKKYYTYLGIKVANILCSFPCAQSGKIVLVDTIGLGSTALNIREQMLETVSNDSDAILLMTRPDAKRPRVEQDDITIVTDIGDKMTAKYTQHLLFWIINRVSDGVGKNVDGIPEIMAQLKKMPNFPVVDFLEANCKDEREVEEKLLIPILQQLSINIPKMDRILLENAQAQLNILYKEYHSIAGKVGQAFSASIDEDTYREFKSTIQDTYNKMSNAIRELYVNKSYSQLRNKPCKKFKAAVEQKLCNILTRIPEKEDVLELLSKGTINQHNAYEILTDRARLSIINDFLKLNDTLYELVKDLKRDIAHCLSDENLGRLGYLISISPNDSYEWLKELTSILQEYPNYSLISEALQKLIDFEMRMESFLIYIVRAHLDVIDISLIHHGPQLRGTLADKEILADDIIFWFEHNLEVVHNEIRAALEPLYSYPNNALWAVIKDFYDRIVYASTNKMEVETSWIYLYEDHISQIWQNEYTLYQAKKGMSERWNALVNEVHKYDKKKIFNFVFEEV